MGEQQDPWDEALAIALDAIDEHLLAADATARRSERNRLSLLHVHAMAALVIAPLFAAMGREGITGPSWVLIRMVPPAPMSLAAVLGAGGLLLAIATWHRRPGWELVGLWMLMAWYATIAAGFSGAVLVWMADGQVGPRPGLYAGAVYGHLFVIMWVHRVTLRKIRRAQRRRRQAVG